MVETLFCSICDTEFELADKYGDRNFCPKCKGSMEYDENYFPALTDKEKQLILEYRMGEQ